MLREIILHQQYIAYLATDIVIREKHIFGNSHWEGAGEVPSPGGRAMQGSA